MASTAGKYALMWSGGKDSALALHRATVAGLYVARLVNFHDSATGRVRFHATPVAMIQAQADAAGMELRAIGTTWPEMDARMTSELAAMRRDGFTGVVFGDIHLDGVRAWYEARTRAARLEHVEPLWKEQPASLIREFVELGGRAVITCVDLGRLDSSWLGRIIDKRFPAEIGETDADPCGEDGEFHSFAFDGPMFTKPVRWRAGATRAEPGFVQLDISPGT